MQLAGVKADINVTAQSPVIDTTSAAAGVTVDQAMMQPPVARNLYATAQKPGVTSDAVGRRCSGRRERRTSIIDGIDATGIRPARR